MLEGQKTLRKLQVFGSLRNKKVVASTGQGSWSELETVRTTVHLPDLTIRESTGCRFVYRITKIIVVAVGSTGGSNVPSDKNELSQKKKKKKKEKRKKKEKKQTTVENDLKRDSMLPPFVMTSKWHVAVVPEPKSKP